MVKTAKFQSHNLRDNLRILIMGLVEVPAR